MIDVRDRHTRADGHSCTLSEPANPSAGGSDAGPDGFGRLHPAAGLLPTPEQEELAQQIVDRLVARADGRRSR